MLRGSFVQQKQDIAGLLRGAHLLVVDLGQHGRGDELHTGLLGELLVPIQGALNVGHNIAHTRNHNHILGDVAHGEEPRHGLREADAAGARHQGGGQRDHRIHRGVRGEVFASTFDETADRQVKISMFALEKAKRLVEKGENVVVLMDSITRFARACNVISSETSRILSGGLSVNALFYPKKFFGAARNIENGGSLTIIATALVETGSKMDDVIFEEFKGTGNMELQLDRNLTYKNIYPAINILSSGTRRDDLLLDKRYFNKVQILKKLLADPTQNEPTEFLINKMRMTRSNEEFLKLMGGI